MKITSMQYGIKLIVIGQLTSWECCHVVAQSGSPEFELFGNQQIVTCLYQVENSDDFGKLDYGKHLAIKKNIHLHQKYPLSHSTKHILAMLKKQKKLYCSVS